MNASTWAAVVSAAVAVLGLALAFVQYRAARRSGRSAEARIAQLSGALGAALAQTRSVADGVDALVQRSKTGAPPDEVVNTARVLRGQLVGLANQLARETRRRDQWTPGAVNTSASVAPGPSPVP